MPDSESDRELVIKGFNTLISQDNNENQSVVVVLTVFIQPKPHKCLSDVAQSIECGCLCVCCVCSDIQRVLQEDREKLKLLQKNQPRFSEYQKKELMEVHPWIKKGVLPKAVDVKVQLLLFLVCHSWFI